MGRPGDMLVKSAVLVAIGVMVIMVGSAALAPVGAVLPASSSGAVAASTPASSSVATQTAPGTTTNPAASYGSQITINSARQAMVDEAHAQAAANGTLSTFFPPTVRQGPPVSLTNGHIIPFYSNAPAAMGIATYGLMNTTGTIQPYIERTTSVEGTVTTGDPLGVQTTNPYYGSLFSYSAQMNLDLFNVTIKGNSGNVLWLQNLFTYNPQTGSFSISEDDWNSTAPYNAYNFSASDAGAGSFPVASTFLYGTGSLTGTLDYSSSAPAFATLHYPFTVDLYINTTVGSFGGISGHMYCSNHVSRCTGVNVIYMNYSVYNGLGQHVCPTGAETGLKVCGSYDTLYVNSTSASNPHPVPLGSAQIEANGFQYAPVGMPADIEMTLGIGSSDGSNSNDNYANASCGIYLWNSTANRFLPPPSAYDFGSGTDETAMGVYGTWSVGANGMPVEQFRSGPPLLVGLWNASGTVSNVGAHSLNYAGITPGNAWLAIAPGAGVTNQSYFAIAPTFGWFTGKGAIGKYIWLQPGVYTVEVMLSGYNEVVQTVNLLTSNQVLSIALTKNPASTIYTPEFAFTNSDLANLSTSGSGTSVSPYILTDNQRGTASLQPVFCVVNTFMFSVWSGVWFNDTTAYAVFNPPPSLYMNYPSWWYPLLNALYLPYPAGYGLAPYNNQLAIYLYDASNVTVAHGASIGGWTFNQVSGTYYDLYVYQGSNDLIYDNYFNVSGHGLELFGAAVSTIASTTWTPVGTTYQVWFNETHLPTGTPWSVTLNSVTLTSMTASIVFTGLATGGYSYTVGAVAGYSASPSSGTVTVGTANVPEAITFTAVGTTYAVTFTESGLTAGTLWSMTLNGNTLNSVVTTIVFTGFSNGPYSYTSGSVNGFAVSPASGTITVSGAAVSQTITYSTARTTEAASFGETGLPAGTAWSVTLAGHTQTSLTTSVVFGGLTNGNYAYTIGAVPGFSASPTSGTISVIGTNQNNYVWGNTFYPYVFPSYDPNNPYSGHSGVDAPSTALTVSEGGDHIYNNAFYTNGTASSSATYVNSWNATGGYQPASNSVTVNGFTLTGSILGQAIQGGNYWFNYGGVANPYGLPYVARASSPTGTASIGHGADFAPLTPYMTTALAATVPTALGLGLYPVTFTEANLAVGGSWTMRIAGVPVNEPLAATTYTTSPTNTTVVGATATTSILYVPNGTYVWTVVSSPAGSSAFVTKGTITVSGAAVGVTVTFGWQVTVKETGLTTGLSWAATVNGKLGVTTAGHWLNFTMASGSWPYTIAAVSGSWTATPATGTVVVGTTTVTLTSTFSTTSAPTYTIFFTGSGIYTGTSWSVTIGSTTIPSTTSSISFTSMAAGSYPYTVTAPAGYTATPATGTVVVTATSMSIGIVFTPVTYTVTFTETGLPGGTAWGLAFGNVLHWSTTSTITFQVRANTYNWMIGYVAGYIVSSQSATSPTTVSGTTSITIGFTP